MRWLSVIAGAVMLLGAIITLRFSPEKVETQKQGKIPLRKALKLTFENRPFLLLQGANSFMLMGAQSLFTVISLGFMALYSIARAQSERTRRALQRRANREEGERGSNPSDSEGRKRA